MKNNIGKFISFVNIKLNSSVMARIIIGHALQKCGLANKVINLNIVGIVLFALPPPNIIGVWGQLSPWIKCIIILHIRIMFFSVVIVGFNSCSTNVSNVVFIRRNNALQDSLLFLIFACDICKSFSSILCTFSCSFNSSCNFRNKIEVSGVNDEEDEFDAATANFFFLLPLLL